MSTQREDLTPDELNGIQRGLEDVAAGRVRPLADIQADMERAFGKLDCAEIGEHYLVEDCILPTLALPDPCPVRIVISADSVILYVGQRDWSWKRGCPDHDSAGTMLGETTA